MILAMSTIDGNELIFVCPETVEDTRKRMEMLPSVTTGLARFRLREVILLRKGNDLNDV